jgi:Type IV secretion-system coupling protein DNA-binding domain
MATNATNPFCYLPPEMPGRAKWSAVDWARDRRGWLFLTSTEDSHAAALPLQNVWLDCLVRQLLTTELGGAKNRSGSLSTSSARSTTRASSKTSWCADESAGFA